jgi:hypothetical protein
MAEQTVMLLFGTYQSWLRNPYPNMSGASAIRVSQYTFLTTMADRVHDAMHWDRWGSMTRRGCNTDSPIFCLNDARQISCIPMAPRLDGVRTYTSYRTRIRLLYDKRCGTRYFTIQCVAGDPIVRTSISVAVSNDIVEKYGMPLRPDGYLVFEIMNDGRPHSRPWVGCPTVGPFNNFDQASSLGIRFEWLDNVQNRGVSIAMSKVSIGWDSIHRANEKQELELALVSWRAAMNLIQALDGIIYDDAHDGFQKWRNFGSIQVVELRTNHLQQSFQ